MLRGNPRLLYPSAFSRHAKTCCNFLPNSKHPDIAPVDALALNRYL